MNAPTARFVVDWRRWLFCAVILHAGFAARAADAPVAPSEWIDPATGHRIVRLSREPGTASLYFHQNAYSPDGKKMILVTPGGISALNLQTRDIELLAPGYRLSMSNSNGIEVSRKEPVVYYSTNANGQTVVMAVNMDTKESKQVAVLPPGAVLGGITADDAMLVGIRNIGGRGRGAAGATTPTAAATTDGGTLNRSSNVAVNAGGTLNLGNNALTTTTIGNLTYSGGNITLEINPALAADIPGLDAVAGDYLNVRGHLTIDGGGFAIFLVSAGPPFIQSGNVVLFQVSSFSNISGNVNALKWAGLPEGFTSTITNVTTASGNHYLVANLAFTPQAGYWNSTTGGLWGNITNWNSTAGAQGANPTAPPAVQPTTPTTETAAPARGQRRGGRGAAGGGGQSKQIYTVDLKTGETKSFFPSDDNLSHDNLNHFECNPTDPSLILFAHEGTWSQVDRIWTMRTDGTGLKLMHPRTMPNEIAGHEFFGHDGQWLYYDLQTPQSGVFWIGGINVKTGERVRYPIERSQWSVHYNVSWDGKVFSGDGGGPDSVANRPPAGSGIQRFDTPQNGQWIYLFRPQPDKATTIEVNGESVKVIPVEAEKLVDMSKHVYRTGREVEPNATFTPDDKWLVFRSDMEGELNTYAVEIAKPSPEVVKEINAQWDAYHAATGTPAAPAN